MTADLPTRTDPTWAKPGPGAWELDKSHFQPTVSRIIRDAIEHGLAKGIEDGFDVVGSPLARLEARFVNGRMYTRQVNLIGGDRELAAPPAPILWLVTRLHPTYRARAKQAAKAVEEKRWLHELERWENEWKPHLVATSDRLGAVTPSSLDDLALADHLAETVAALHEGSVLHFRLHVSDLGPIGRLLVRGRSWGFEPTELMTTLAGSSPATNAPSKALERLRRLVAAAPTRPTSLEEVRALSEEAAGQLDDYLGEFGHRLTTGYDITALTLAEMPAAVLATLCAPAQPPNPDAIGAEAFASLREHVPDAERAEFDELVDEARKLYGLRDENGPLTHEWPAGLVRRAVLEAAKRLVTAGRLTDTDQVYDLTASELDALLRGRPGPSNDEIERRWSHRHDWPTLQAPESLGELPEPPPAWALPGPLADQLEIVLAVLDLLETRAVDNQLCGVGVGTDTFRGTARVVSDPTDALERVEPGDIVVAPFTVPTYNAVLAMAGAVVVEHGGVLCHAAVIAREYDIPAVVGASGAVERIPDGATIEVDPRAGSVRIVSE